MKGTFTLQPPNEVRSHSLGSSSGGTQGGLKQERPPEHWGGQKMRGRRNLSGGEKMRRKKRKRETRGVA